MKRDTHNREDCDYILYLMNLSPRINAATVAYGRTSLPIKYLFLRFTVVCRVALISAAKKVTRVQHS